MNNSVENIHENLVIDILKTGDMIASQVSKLFREFGLTQVQYNILKVLQNTIHKPISVGELKERISFSNPDITRLIDRLVGKEIVKREACDENRRKIYVSITDKGVDLMNSLAPKIAVKLENFYNSAISPDEAGQLSAALKKIRKSI